MIENYAWLGMLLFTNTLDYIVMYLMAHNIGGHKLENKWKHYMLLLLCGVIIGTLVYLSLYDRASLRIAPIVFSLIIIKLVTNRKISDIFLIYATAFLILFFVQSAIVWFVVLWGITDEAMFLIVQSLTLVTSALLLWKVSLYEIFLLIKQKLLLTMGIILLFAISYALLITFQFNIHNAFEQMFLLGVLIIITLISFFTILIVAQGKIDQASNKYHDLVNKFTGLYLSIEAADNPEKIKTLSRELKKHVTGKEQIEPLTDSHEANLAKILQDKLMDREKGNELILDLGYHEHHATVSLGDITYMLGSLFDNCLDHGLDQPIFVYLNVCENIFELTVKNSCKKIPNKKMTKLFKKGFSMKEQVGHGQGLYKLKCEVEAYNDQRFKAKIATECYYDVEFACDYLEMMIEISD